MPHQTAIPRLTVMLGWRARIRIPLRSGLARRSSRRCRCPSRGRGWLLLARRRSRGAVGQRDACGGASAVHAGARVGPCAVRTRRRDSGDTIETSGGKTTDSREVQANVFAAELLAPADGVRSFVDGEPSLDDVVVIAARSWDLDDRCALSTQFPRAQRRYEVLKREIADGLDEVVWARLAPAPVLDAIAAIDPGSLPRLSPVLRGSALAEVAGGAASVGDAAAAAGCDSARLASGAAAIGV